MRKIYLNFVSFFIKLWKTFIDIKQQKLVFKAILILPIQLQILFQNKFWRFSAG